MNNLRNFPPDTLGIFQSTLLQEERHKFSKLSNITLRFQSTLLQEERHIGVLYISVFCHFNPRSYKRSDGSSVPHFIHLILFQSTLLQEERLVQTVVHFYCNFISIHAPTRGATCHTTRFLVSSSDFNPRSYKRSD